MDLALAHQDLILGVSAVEADTGLACDLVGLLDVVAAAGLVEKDLNVFVWFVDSNLQFHHNFYNFYLRKL